MRGGYGFNRMLIWINAHTTAAHSMDGKQSQ